LTFDRPICRVLSSGLKEWPGFRRRVRELDIKATLKLAGSARAADKVTEMFLTVGSVLRPLIKEEEPAISARNAIVARHPLSFVHVIFSSSIASAFRPIGALVALIVMSYINRGEFVFLSACRAGQVSRVPPSSCAEG
jgi:hypothetical protein